MGALQSNYTWYIYSRDATSNSWNPEPIYTSQKKSIGIFKHFVWRFALQNNADFQSYKAIYLYQGSTRHIKAELIKPEVDNYYKLQMEFKDNKLANEWDIEDEQIVDTNILWKETQFNKHYVTLDQETRKWCRKWQLIKPIPNSKPGLPRLSLIQYITSTIHDK